MRDQPLPRVLPAALKAARQQASRIRTQREAGQALHATSQLSPSLVAQYESGKIKNPDPRTLSQLAAVYEADYLELALAYLWERYAQPNGEELSSHEEERWRLLHASVLASRDIQADQQFNLDVLRSKSYLLRNYDVLDMDGMAHWERSFPDLKEMWIVAPDFLDDCHDAIEAAVVNNVQREVLHYYFLPEDDKTNTRHDRLQKRIAEKSGREKAEIRKYLRSIPLSIEDLTWLHSDVIVANPRVSDGAEGYITIRKNGVPDLAIKMEPTDVVETVLRLESFVKRHESRTGEVQA